MLCQSSFPAISYINSDINTEISTQKAPFKIREKLNFIRIKNINKRKKLMENFHITFLRDSLQANEKLKPLFSTLLPKNSIQFPKFNSSITSTSNFNTLKSSNESNKNNNDSLKNILSNKKIFITENKNYKKKREKLLSMQKKQIFFCFTHHNSRNENLTQFNNKVRTIRYEKIIKLAIDEEIKKTKEKIYTNVSLVELDIYNYKLMLKLFIPYLKERNRYLGFLNKTIIFETAENNSLKEKISNLMNDIFIIKHKLGKIQKIFENNLSNKFFLLCVKNYTNQIEKFNEEDKKNYEYDKYLIKNIFSYHSITRQLKRQKTLLEKLEIRRRSLKRRSINVSEQFDVNYYHFPKPIIIFNDVDDFFRHLDKISIDIKNYIVEYNKINNELIEMRNLFKKRQDEIDKEEKMDNFFNEELLLSENKLLHMKFKNDELMNYKNSLLNEQNNKNNKNKNFVLVKKKIYEIFKNMCKGLNLVIKREFNQPITTLLYLKDIESQINNLIRYKQIQEEENSENYNLIKKEIEKNNKLKQYLHLKESRQNDFNNKIKKIYEKNNKIIIKKDRRLVNTILNSIQNKKIINNK